MDMVDILGFFFTLSMMQIGQVCASFLRLVNADVLQQYSSEKLSPTQITMVADLRDFALVYFPQVSPTSGQTYKLDLYTVYLAGFNDCLPTHSLRNKLDFTHAIPLRQDGRRERRSSRLHRAGDKLPYLCVHKYVRFTVLAQRTDFLPR